MSEVTAARQRTLDAYREAMARVSNPEALAVYDSNSFRRVGLAREYKELVYACNQSDGHPDIAGTDLLRAMVAAYNAMLTWADQEAGGLYSEADVRAMVAAALVVRDAKASRVTHEQKMKALNRYHVACCDRAVCGDEYQRELVLATEDCLRLMDPAPPRGGEQRNFRGIGHLEQTGYIPEGSAAEREASHEPTALSARIEWGEIQKPSDQVSYDHVVGITPFGRVLITWKGWKDDPSPTIDESPWGWGGIGDTVEGAKRIADEEYRRRLAQAIQPVTKPGDRP